MFDEQIVFRAQQFSASRGIRLASVFGENTHYDIQNFPLA